MKFLVRSSIILWIVLLALNLNSFAQKKKSFKGMVTFSIEYSGKIEAATMAQLPKTTTVLIMTNKQKMTMVVGPVVIEAINDGEKKEAITLLNMMGEKKYYKVTQSELEADMAEKGTYNIVYTDVPKIIQGFECKQAEYITTNREGQSDTAVVYFSEKLGGQAINFGAAFHGLKGFPLEYTIKKNGIVTKVSATQVKKSKVTDADFIIPGEYVELTAEEKAQMKAALSGKE